MTQRFLFISTCLLTVLLAKAQMKTRNVVSNVYNNVYIDRNDDGSVLQNDMVAYKMSLPDDTIEFLKADNSDKKMPVFVFVQGSQPIPLVLNYGNNLTATFLNNIDKGVLSKYHVIEITMPNTPLYCDSTFLDDQCRYIPTGKPMEFDYNYVRRNHLDTYLTRAYSVIDYITTQQWADEKNIVVFGHSQGAYIAAALAARDKRISAVGLASFCPLGRMQGQVIEARLNGIAGKTTIQQATDKIKEISDYWRYLQNADDKEYQKSRKGDLPSTTKSFSQPVFEEISKLSQPVFIAYGTSDYHSVLCELFPLYFAQYEKENYKVVPMSGRGHNFENINEDGTHDWNDIKWHEVTSEFLKFVDSHKNKNLK